MGSNFTGPLKNQIKSDGVRRWFNGLPIGQEPDLCVYFNDFLATQDYAASDWVITTTEDGAGDASEALAADEACGALKILNDDADNDVDSLQMAEENWRCASGKRLWMEMRVKVSDADDVDMFVGLAITDTSPRDATDRIGFALAEGSAVIKTVCAKDSTGSDTASGVSAADDTYVKLGVEWDGVSTARFYIDRSLVREVTSNIPNDENLAITLNIQNGAAGGDSLIVDYIYVAQER
jgi:hypothetical protein